MPQIQIRREQLHDPDAWPAFCLRCGQPAAGPAPVPRRYTKDGVDLAVPVCAEHAGHWARFRRANRVGILLVVLLGAAAAAGLWLTIPAAPGPRGEGEKFATVVVATLGVLLAAAVPLLIWIGAHPVRVAEVTPNRVTLDGVAREFVPHWNRAHQPAPLTEGGDTPAMEVTRYRPDGVCPSPGALRLLILPASLGCALGGGVALGAGWVTEWTRNWPPNDPRFAAVTAGVLFAYMGPVLFGFRLKWLFSLKLLLPLAAAAGVLAGCSGLLALFGFGTLGFHVLLALALPALLVTLLTPALSVQANKVRHVLAAGLAGLLAPLALAATAVYLGGGPDGPLRFLLWLGPVAALIAAATAVGQARQPFCALCDSWMVQRSLGAVARPRAEVEPVLAAGQILRLAGEPVRDKGDPGDVELAMYSCPNCTDAAHVVVELTEVYKTDKGATSRRGAGRWVYPGLAFTVLEKMFPPQEEKPAGDEGQGTAGDG